jgi:hypothetical protein
MQLLLTDAFYQLELLGVDLQQQQQQQQQPASNTMLEETRSHSTWCLHGAQAPDLLNTWR